MFDPEGKVYNYKCLLYNRNGVSFFCQIWGNTKVIIDDETYVANKTQVFMHFKRNSNKDKVNFAKTEWCMTMTIPNMHWLLNEHERERNL